MVEFFMRIWPLTAFLFILNPELTFSKALEGPMQLSIERDSRWGQSVYVTGPTPYWGQNNCQNGIKLLPTHYPEWSLRVQFPQSEVNQSSLTYCLIDDGPAMSESKNSETKPELSQKKLNRKPVIYEYQQLIHYSPTLGISRPLGIFSPQKFSTSKKTLLLYFHDGQNIFEHVRPGQSSAFSWKVDEWLPPLAEEFSNYQLIAIAIGNTRDRLREYLPPESTGPQGVGIGDQYLTMIDQEIMPLIEKKLFPSKKGPSITRALIGSSMGGLINLYAASLPNFSQTGAHPIDGIFALSPSLQFREIEQRLASIPMKGIHLYLDSGTTGGNNDNYYLVYKTRDALLTQGRVFGLDLWHQVGRGEPHHETAWARRAPLALRWWIQNLQQSNP